MCPYLTNVSDLRQQDILYNRSTLRKLFPRHTYPISPQGGLIGAAFATMAIEAFAVFNNGAYFLGPMTLGVASAWAVFLALTFLSHRELIAALSPAAVTSIIILSLLWLWTGISITWSIASDLTWIEFNRTGGYLALFALGLFVGTSPTARSLAAWLFFFIASAAGIYALGAKALPTIIDNLDNASRVSIPLGYTNAVGLLVALAFPLSLYFAASRAFHWLLRLSSALMAPLLLISLFFTLSRGATLALALGLITYFAAVPLRLRSFGLILLSMPPALLIGWWSNKQSALMENHVELGLRIGAASNLRQYLLYALFVVGIVFLIALVIGRRVQFPKILSRAAGLLAILLILSSVAIGAFIFIGSKSSFSELMEKTHNYLTVDPTGAPRADRLFVLSSSGRWQLWEEALANWEANPITGTGAQTFPLVHLIRRETGTPFVKQPHGLPFRLLSELGIVGFALGELFIVFTLTVSLLRTYKIRDRWQRGLARTLFSLLVIYLIHTSYDWDWNMFALTMSYFFFTGILIGWRREPDSGVSHGVIAE